MINQLPPSDDVFEQLSGSFFNNSFKSITNNKDNASKVRMIVFAIVLLTYVGVEAVRIIFRSNFGRKGIGIWQFIISIIVFVAITVFSYNSYSSFDNYMADYGSETSFFYTAIFYFGLSIFLLVKGIVEIRKKGKTTKSDSYRGDSILLGFLSESGWNQAKIQNLAEPLLVLAIGVSLSPINLLLGLPLIISAISVWVHYLYDYLRGLLDARNELSNRRGYLEPNKKTFSRAK